MSRPLVRKIGTLRGLGVSELRQKFRSIGAGADVVTAAALGVLFREPVAESAVAGLVNRDGDEGQALHDRQVQLSGVPGIGIESHAESNLVRARGQSFRGPLA